MGYIQGEGRNQSTLFPLVLDDFVPADHVCRVIDAFVYGYLNQIHSSRRLEAECRRNVELMWLLYPRLLMRGLSGAQRFPRLLKTLRPSWSSSNRNLLID